MTDVTHKFEAGRTYGTRSACDHDCIFRFTVERRTERSVWISERGGEPKRRQIKVYCGSEQIMPYGSYSMAAILSADERALELGED